MQMNTRADFIRWYNEEFKLSRYWSVMECVTEDSPYHRERNVAVHTDMVVNHGLEMNLDVISLMALAYHDVGKPHAMLEKYSDSRGHYKAFPGHELKSANMFRNANTAAYYIDDFAAYAIQFLIEYHLPYSTNDKHKLNNLYRTLQWLSPTISALDFYGVLRADARGRMSDDHAAKLTKVDEWIKNFNDNFPTDYNKYEEKDKVVYLLIGPSCSGKSTFLTGPTACNRNTSNSMGIHSLDTLRMEWYPSGSYAESWALAKEDGAFFGRAHEHFSSLIKNDTKVIFVDNTNLTRKNRRFYITMARQHGYNVEAVYFNVPLNVLLARNRHRQDLKAMGPDVIRDQYYSLQLPLMGEFDKIIFA